MSFPPIPPPRETALLVALFVVWAWLVEAARQLLC